MPLELLTALPCLRACVRSVLTATGTLALATAPVRAALATYVTPEQLAERSSVVVEGTVVQRGSALDPVTGALATYTTLAVETVHRGTPGLEQVVIREPGGRLGDMVHEVDAVPEYALGEHVLAFLEPDADGALRTTAWFFGKFRLADESTARVTALRDLGGHGRILGRAAPEVEEWPRADLVAVAATVPQTTRRVPELAVPAEFGRLKWQELATVDPGAVPRNDGSDAPLKFVSLSPGNPTRWNEVDAGGTVRFYVERARNPLGDGAAAVFEIARAMAAWNAVPESRVTLAMANDNYGYTTTYSTSPADVYPALSVVLFGDPYEDIPDPVGCSGVLAIGGYWRSATARTTLNGQAFYDALRGYVIFADGFECFLGDRDNLAEVAAHELGHTLGFGHSTTWDSVMRSSPYGWRRGPRLGDDDRDAAHCYYPHALTLTAPNGGEVWEAGTLHPVTWNSTAESGPDPGTLDLELSLDGTTWTRVAAGQPNSGRYNWRVPTSPTGSARLRVIQPNHLTPPPGYPAACSQDVSNSTFAITAHVAGSIPYGRGTGLRLDKDSRGAVRLDWPASCSAAADDYAIYEGSLDALHRGEWDAVPHTCGTGADLNEILTPGVGPRYFLVTPLGGGFEGSLGSGSAGPRPVPAVHCGTPQTAAGCE